MKERTWGWVAPSSCTHYVGAGQLTAACKKGGYACRTSPFPWMVDCPECRRIIGGAQTKETKCLSPANRLRL
jgi:hypothetical protein